MISIVMTYFERKAQLDITLSSIRRSSVKDYEVIIVDDASGIPLQCPEATVLRIEPKDKWWSNPCAPYNIGFEHASGDIIIIQNPECMHAGDILAHALDNVCDGTYLSYGCYAANRIESAEMRTGKMPVIHDKRFDAVLRNGWYNHSRHRDVAYHFCSAITSNDLCLVDGFDEAYAKGVSFDDDDFVQRIKSKGINISIIDDPFVIHQWHIPVTYQRHGWKELHVKNKALFKSKWK